MRAAGTCWCSDRSSERAVVANAGGIGVVDDALRGEEEEEEEEEEAAGCSGASAPSVTETSVAPSRGRVPPLSRPSSSYATREAMSMSQGGVGLAPARHGGGACGSASRLLTRKPRSV